MKKLLLITLVTMLSTAPAYTEEGHGHGHGGHEGHGGGWIIPSLIDSAIVYDLTNPYQVYSQPYPVYPLLRYMISFCLFIHNLFRSILKAFHLRQRQFGIFVWLPIVITPM